jgi:hypothetical protein
VTTNGSVTGTLTKGLLPPIVITSTSHPDQTLTFAGQYRGQRLRFAAWIKTENVVARGDLWGRSQGRDSPAYGKGLSGGWQILAPTSDWWRYAVVFDLPPVSEVDLVRAWRTRLGGQRDAQIRLGGSH